MPRAVSMVGQLIAHERFCDAVDAEVAHLTSALRGADLGAPCTTCPDWTLEDLAKHAGAVHRWAGQMVKGVMQERLDFRDVVMDRPDEAARLADWLDDGRAPLVAALRGADPDALMWAWGADKHARFWSRRVVHETTVHRSDAEISRGVVPLIEDWIAIDGIDEFLVNLPHARRFAPNVEKLSGDGESIGLRAGGEAWTIRLLPDRFEWARTDDHADVTVEGAPGDMYLFVWGRKMANDLEVKGHEELLRRWVGNSSM